MIVTVARTVIALGLPNLARLLWYKLGLKLGFNPVKRLRSELLCGEFFKSDFQLNDSLQPNEQWLDKHHFFGHSISSTAIPEWHKSCLTGSNSSNTRPWFSIVDFDFELGDIKGVWEASRLDWVVCFAQHAKAGNKATFLRLNQWLNDWIQNNPTYFGVNWKCGQEASIRVMHLAVAALILKQTRKTSAPLLFLIKAHLKRISPTIMYAVAQDNNHGTSEAAALFIGGSWLAMNGDSDGLKWQRKGVTWLENRASRLIENDGSFSQYSVTYHRMMLDTYSLVEVWRRKYAFPEFSRELYRKLGLASEWLYYFTCDESGDAPNLGANDGARLIPLVNTDYRNFKPSVQLANTLFNNSNAYPNDTECSLALDWLGIDLPELELKPKENKDFTFGGYCFMKRARLSLYLNYPIFKFRPSQCDILHLDLWLNGINIFRDGGTFSYNAGYSYIDYYGGVQSHNSVQFDGHEQMPRLSRFLLGGWLKVAEKQALTTSKDSSTFSVSYRDRFNCSHQRKIELFSSKLVVTDILSGFKESAVSRFRLAPIEWRLVDNTFLCECCSIAIKSSVPTKRLELTNGKESRYYYNESHIPVLEIEITEAGTITTEITF